MKKLIAGTLPLLLLSVVFSGCAPVGETTANLSIIYGASAVLSLLLLIGCLILVRKKRQWFILLFSSVFVVNVGYTLLSISPNLQTALWANRLSYLGSVFLPISMLMIIFSVTNINPKKWLKSVLICLAFVVFLITASPGILDIYYKEVSFEIVNGVSTLVKVYGPLHPLYLVYLVGYFTAMVAVIVRAYIRKTIDTTAHAIIIAIAVFVNIGVWFIEQLTNIDFEFLSISYIISELFLMGVHLVMRENQRLKDMLKQKDKALLESKNALNTIYVSDDEKMFFLKGLETLTPTEQHIYEAYLTGCSTKEIMSTLNIKENTLKFHNKNLYGKLGVSSRKQLVLIGKVIQVDNQE